MFPKIGNIDGLIDSIREKTKLSKNRLEALYSVGLYCSELDGDFAELGCCNGGASFLLASIVKNPHKLYAFDSFEGLPEPTSEDEGKLKQGRSKTDAETVKAYLGVHGNRVVVKQGWIDDTLRSMELHQFSLIHIDMDLYAPTKFAIEFLWKRIVRGGYMIFDDYRWGSTPGIKKAVDEFFGDLFRHNIYFVYPQLGVQK